MKEAETWHCLRTEAELTFPDFESPNYIMPIPSSLKVHVVISILFLVIPSQTYGEPHSCSWKWDYVQCSFPRYTAGDVMLSPLLAVPSCKSCFLGRGHSLLRSQADHSLPRSQSLGWYFLESNVIIKVSVRLLSPCHSLPRGQAGSGTNRQEFTLGQLSLSPQNAQTAPKASCASSGTLWERKIDKPLKKKKIYFIWAAAFLTIFNYSQ